jgi:hypothetical protein
MVNKACNPWNTRVEIAPDSITWSEPNTTYKGWLFQKARHLSVSSYYKTSSKLRLFFEPFTRGLFYLVMILALIFGNVITQLATVLLFIIRYVVQLSIINGSSKHFGGRKYILSLPVLDIYLPLVNLYIMLFGKKGKSERWK